MTVLPRALQVLSPDAATRDTAAACDRIVANFLAAAAADPRLYALAQRAQDTLRSAPADSAPAADRQLAKLYAESGRLAGAGLDSAGRARSVRLLQRHADLERDFNIALAADSTVRSGGELLAVDPVVRMRGVDPVENEMILSARGAIDRKTLQKWFSGSAGRLRHDRRKVTSLWNGFDLLLGDRSSGKAFCDVDQRSRRGHRDRLGDAHFHRQVYSCRFPERDVDARGMSRLVAR